MFIRLTRLDNTPIWLNASFIVTIEPRRGGGSIVVPIGDGLDYEVREKADEVLGLLNDAPVPAVVPVPVSDCLTQTPDDVSPEPERTPRPEFVENGGRSFEKPVAEKSVAKDVAKAAEETASAEAASAEPSPAEPPAEPGKPVRKTRKTATKKATTATKTRKRTTKKAAAEAAAAAEPQPEPPQAEAPKTEQGPVAASKAEPPADAVAAVEAAPTESEMPKPKRSVHDFAQPEGAAFSLDDGQVERLRRMMPKSVRKLSNTLVAQFRVEEPEAAIKALEDRGVLRIEFNHVIWA